RSQLRSAWRVRTRRCMRQKRQVEIEWWYIRKIKPCETRLFMTLVAGLQLVNVVLKTRNHSDELLQFCRRNTRQNFPTCFTDNGFHLSDDRCRFVSQFDTFGTTIAGAGLPGN